MEIDGLRIEASLRPDAAGLALRLDASHLLKPSTIGGTLV